MRLPILILFFCFALELLTDFYGWKQLRSRGRNAKRWYLGGCGFTTLLLIVILFLPRRSESVSVLTSMWCLYGWLSLTLIKIFYVVFSLLGKVPRLLRKRTVDLGLWIGLPLGVIIAIILWWGALFTVRDISVEKADIVSASVPSAFNGYRIVQFSDAHVGTWGNDTTFISALVDSINSLHPDLIVFTGDLVNRMTSEARPFLSVLSRLNAPDGVISILGNHDYGDYVNWESDARKSQNMEEMYEFHRKAGWELLDNDHKYIRRGNDSIAVIGVGNWGEPPFHVYGSLEQALTAKNDTILAKNDPRFRILLTHNPEHWKQIVAPETDIDLSLSGHTHAMQMMLKIGNRRLSPASWKYKQWGGLYSADKNNSSSPLLYVNIGSGEVGFPARLGWAFPEITLLTLRHIPAHK